MSEDIRTANLKKEDRILLNYLGTLVDIYLTDEPMPFKQRIVGLTIAKHFNTIQSKEELLGRIKSLMIVLGLENIETDNGKINFEEVDKHDS